MSSWADCKLGVFVGMLILSVTSKPLQENKFSLRVKAIPQTSANPPLLVPAGPDYLQARARSGLIHPVPLDSWKLLTRCLQNLFQKG